MELVEEFVFQVDSDIVSHYYDSDPNYLIEFNHKVAAEYCIVYFSSNNIYYPNNEAAFTESIIRKDRFEWYGSRIEKGHKHIFIRDIRKQWYLTGINKIINTTEKLIEFIKEQTKGYKVIVIGSSAGGFCSVIIGQLIEAESIYTFNGQFEILSLLETSDQKVDPIIFRNKENINLLPYYNTLNFINDATTIFYFHSNNSSWDKEQLIYAKSLKMNVLSFNTSNHGLPFLRTNLNVVLNLPVESLRRLAGQTYHPLSFSLKMVGFIETIYGLKSIFNFALNKIYIRTFQKWKLK